jgi:hypothetical protein
MVQSLFGKAAEQTPAADGGEHRGAGDWSERMKDPTFETIKNQMHTMIDASENFNADLTQVIGSDRKGQILAVAVFAKGSYAKLLARFLKKLDREAGVKH